MTGAVEVPPGERGVVRVFAVDLPGPEAEAFAADPAALARALGLASIDTGHADVFPVARLAGIGLATYLAEGHGIPAERLDASMLDALRGHVAVIGSGAFGADGATLTVASPLRHVATYAEEAAPVRFDPLPSKGADGILSGAPVAPPPPPLRGGRAGKVIALAVLAALFVALAFLGGNR